MRNISKTFLNEGLSDPVRILHITDIHITQANDSDSEEYHELMKKRCDLFYNEGEQPPKTPSEYFIEAIDTAEKNGMLLVNTGDSIDLYTQGCLQEYRRIADGHDMMFSPGGHEHQRDFVRTMTEPDDYYIFARERLKKEFSEYDLELSSRIVNGLNIVCADNSLDYYSASTLAKFKKELEKGLPVIVFSHDPVWDQYLNKKEAYHPNIKLTQEEYESNSEMIELLLSDPLVIATFGGHTHFDETALLKGKTHYATSALFKGNCRYIEVR